jgi:hypothetical protein
MTYLVVGIDLHTLDPWHRNVRAHDVSIAKRIAMSSARRRGSNLVVAAVLGPNSNILPDDAAASKAA